MKEASQLDYKIKTYADSQFQNIVKIYIARFTKKDIEGKPDQKTIELIPYEN